MEKRSLIRLLNYSRTLIQNGEIKFICYRQNFIRPDKVGEQHRKKISDLERQLRENPSKSDDPEGLRVEILQHIEGQKKYGAFRDSNEWFNFVEANLVYQPKYAYRVEIISRYEKYPSFNASRFYGGGGGQFYRFSNGTKKLSGVFPIQFRNTRQTGSSEESELEKPEDAFEIILSIATDIPPHAYSPIPIDETRTKVHLTENSDGMPIYIITTLSESKAIKEIIFVRLKNGLPEIFRRENHYKDVSPLSDEEGYRLGEVIMYKDFEWIEVLNISVPKVIEEQQFSFADNKEFMNWRTIVTIKEMDFNLQLPANYFDWDKAELAGDNVKHSKNRSSSKKEEDQATEK